MSEQLTVSAPSWFEWNHHHLVDELAALRARLGATESAPLRPHPTWGAADGLPPPAIETLTALFALSRFERALLVLCAGVELDAAFPPLCAKANGDLGCAYPTFSLALALLPEPHWSAVTPDAPLRRWLLVDVARTAGVPLTMSPLRIDERILHYLTGVHYPDERLADLAEPLGGDPAIVPSHEPVVRAIAALWSGPAAIPVVQLVGSDEETKRDIVVAASRTLGVRAFTLRPAALANLPYGFETLARLWDREAGLSGAALYIEADSRDGPEPAALTRRLVERLRAPVVLSVREPWPIARRGVRRFEIAKPAAHEQRALWQAALATPDEPVAEAVDRIVAQFDLGAGAIRDAASSACAQTSGDGLAQRAWDAARSCTRPAFSELAQHVRSAAGFDDLVLPERQKLVLREIGVHVRHRSTVYERWGFGALTPAGLGITALFAGPSGTGKTMAAAVLASDLRLDLYRIDLSSVVSKYIGETEKNLRRLFDAAEGGGAILFFDEADALFGKRSEVKDSHDRYANIEINYLLQRIEAYRGLAILSTNMKSALDEAFLRRLRFVVEFPFPDATLRTEIWRRAFPASSPTAGIALERLARLNVTGGSIRTIAMHAAFLAAESAEPIGMAHLRHAAHNEYLKLERPAAELAEIFGSDA